MITRPPLNNTRTIFKNIGCALVFFALSAPVHGAVTDLATKPLTTSTTVLPNLMFILDDSGSMAWAYMPDNNYNPYFAGKYGFASSQCNGVYYNPRITYTPPVTSTGTSYANSTFTSAWKNGYNTGSGTVNLSTSFVDYNDDNTTNASGFSSQAAFYYKYAGTQTAAADKNYYNTGSTFYTECNTTPSGSGATATITITSASSASVSRIKVNGTTDIMDGSSSSSSTTSTVASNIASEINSCTSWAQGNCDVSGYSATASGNVLTITGPASAGDTITVIMNSNSMTANGTSMSSSNTYNNVATFTASTAAFTKVTVSSTSGDTAAGKPADERQNFANWYSYYRTRMKMMKTESGLAFSPIDSNFRVAYMTINNSVNPSFLNFAPFDATQKSNWYAKLYGAVPNGATPLREALANAGRIYAKKLTSLYGVTITDPVEHSCQKNFTILSTDGFWNGNAGFKLDGTTAVGNQDGIEPRPYNDGAETSITRTTTQLQMSQTQITKSTSQLLQTTSQYQTRTSTLQKQVSQRQSRTSYLQKQLSQLKSSTSTLQTRSGTLQTRTYSGWSWSAWSDALPAATATLTITSANSARVDRIRVNGSIDIMRDRTDSSSTTSTVASRIASEINQCTSSTQGNCDVSGYSASASGNIVTITGPASAGNTFTVIMDEGSMTANAINMSNSNTYNNVGTFVAGTTPSCTWSSSRQCQYSWGSWSNAASCTTDYSTSTSYGTTWEGNGTGCQYTAWTTAANTSSCTGVAQSTGPAYTVATATLCSTPVTSAWANTAACTAGTDGSGLTTECRYGGATAWSNVATCTDTSQDYISPTATECQWSVTSPWATASTCTAGTDGSGVKTECQYAPWTTWAAVPATGSTATLTINTASSAVIDKNFRSGSNVIVSDRTSSSTSNTSTLAGYLAARINACTNYRQGECDVSGYSAVAAGNVVTITGPSSAAGNTLSWSMDNGSMTSTKTPFVAVEASCTEASQDYATQTARECQVNAVSVGVSSCTPGGNITCSTATTGPTDVSSCTAASASSGNSYTATTCSTRVKTPAQGVSTCTAAAASTSNGGVATVCNTSTTTASVATCTPQTASGTNSWKTITCSAPSTSAGTSDTLADVAEYYYVTDLRTSALANCTGATGNTLCVAGESQTDTNSYNNVLTSGEDKANWQHMTTYTLGLGVRGSMAYTSPSYLSDSSGDFYSVLMGSLADSTAVPPVCSWQANGTKCNWPVPVSNTQTAIDDLWHAGVNGRGTYFSAADPAELSDGLARALDSIRSSSNTLAAATVSNPSVKPGDNFTFGSSFSTTGWDGNFVRNHIDADPTSATAGSTIIDSSTGEAMEDWSARAKLNVKASRTIYTYDPTNAYNGGGTNKLKPFLWANLSTTEQNYFKENNISTSPPSGTTGLSQYLGTTAGVTMLTTTNKGTSYAAGENLVNYLRGVRTYESAPNDNNDGKYYRARSHLLGDIVNSGAAYVRAPKSGYSDAGYGAFKASRAQRQPMVYVGANDGMLHAFYAYGGDGGDGHDPVQYMDTATGNVVASSGAGIIQVNGGDEAWAYIPTMVLPKLYTLADKNYTNKHQYFVDGTPVTGDICPTVPSTACTSSQWKTILVGGLNGGGKGYYALDITNPAAPKALWEFTTANDANVGYGYGNPMIVKLDDADGTWAVLVTSGYNNADGVGRLYVLNANTGAIIRTISTGAGSAGTPSGLSKINAMVSSSGNKASKVVQVYGGDLLGNVWRFDVNGNVGAAGYDAQLLATLKTAGSVVQPITTIPEIGKVDGNVVVFVGTGKYLGTSDLTDTTQHSMYAIKDPLTGTATPNTTAIYTNVRSGASFVQQTLGSSTCPAGLTICTEGTTVRTGSNNAVNFASNNGWYIDFLDSGERANTNPALVLGSLFFTTNVPQVSSCSSGGYSFEYFINYRTGAPVTSTESPGNTILGEKLRGATLATDVSVLQLYDGSLRVKVRTSGGGDDVRKPPTPTPGQTVRRTSWRELITDQ